MTRPTIYISHAFRDKNEVAIPLQTQLRSRGFPAVLGNDETVPLNRASQNSLRIIQSASFAVFFLAPEFKEGTWPEMEVQHFIHKKRQAQSEGANGTVLIPVLYRSDSYDPQPQTASGNQLTSRSILSQVFADRFSRDDGTLSSGESISSVWATRRNVPSSIRELLQIPHQTSLISEERNDPYSGMQYLSHFRRTKLIDRIVEQVCKAQRTTCTVFISHAGDDKDDVAIPIYDQLVARGITCFVDERGLRPSQVAKKELEKAMQSADIGIFILSPEFAGRNWPLKELMCFLKRHRDAEEADVQGPNILPVFYRLNVADCSDLNLYRHTSRNGRIIFEQGFFEPDRQAEIPTKKAAACMQELTGFSGIRNDEGAVSDAECRSTGGENELHENRMRRQLLISRVVDAVIEVQNMRAQALA